MKQKKYELKLKVLKTLEKGQVKIQKIWQWFVQDLAVGLFILSVILAALLGTLFVTNAVSNYFGQMPNEARIATYLGNETRYTNYGIEPENVVLLEQACHQITGGNSCSQDFEVHVEGRNKIIGTCIWGTRREKMVCTTDD